MTLENFLQQERKLHEVVKGLPAFLEFDQQIHITAIGLAAAGKRSKKS
jgi:hypothetical protein